MNQQYRKFVKFMVYGYQDDERLVVAVSRSSNLIKDFNFPMKSKGLELGDSIGYHDLNSHQRREVREWFGEIQEGMCCYCAEPLNDDPFHMIRDWEMPEELFPHGFLKYPIHLHHDHVSGAMIGAIHSKCNAHSWVVMGI